MSSLCSSKASPTTDLPTDQEDEALNRWKASLGLATGAALPVAPGDTRRCVIESLALEVEGRPDITIDLTAPGSVEALKSKPFIIKEGAKFRMKAKFRVQHDVLSGLKYLQVVKRGGIRVGKDEEMLVSLRFWFVVDSWGPISDGKVGEKGLGRSFQERKMNDPNGRAVGELSAEYCG